MSFERTVILRSFIARALTVLALIFGLAQPLAAAGLPLDMVDLASHSGWQSAMEMARDRYFYILDILDKPGARQIVGFVSHSPELYVVHLPKNLAEHETLPALQNWLMNRAISTRSTYLHLRYCPPDTMPGPHHGYQEVSAVDLPEDLARIHLDEVDFLRIFDRDLETEQVRIAVKGRVTRANGEEEPLPAFYQDLDYNRGWVVRQGVRVPRWWDEFLTGLPASLGIEHAVDVVVGETVQVPTQAINIQGDALAYSARGWATSAMPCIEPVETQPTRAEAIAYILRREGLDVSQDVLSRDEIHAVLSQFADRDEIPAAYESALALAVRYGFLVGEKHGDALYLRPDRAIAPEEMDLLEMRVKNWHLLQQQANVLTVTSSSSSESLILNEDELILRAMIGFPIVLLLWGAALWIHRRY